MSNENLAVVNTPNRVVMGQTSNRRKTIAEEERELAELIAAQKVGTSETETPSEEVKEDVVVVAEEVNNEEEPKSKEAEKAPETGWEKRYKDLQRFMSRKDDEIKKLKTQLEQPVEGPGKVTKERVQEWVKKYPDVANIVKSLAKEIAEEQYGAMSQALEDLDRLKTEQTIARTENAILKDHPDYLDIKEDPEFHKWLETMPSAVQAVVYDTIDDPKGVSRIIKLYKTEMSKMDDVDDTDRNAASISTRRKTAPEVSRGNKKFLFSESQIERMTAAEYQKNYEAIMEARANGQIKYDISGNSR